jgi:endoglucanase
VNPPLRIARIAGLALAGLVLFLASGCGSSSSSSSSVRLPRTAQGRAEAASKRFFKTYVEPDGRVNRPDQGNDTVGEGQAYAMLMAAAIGDSKTFDSAWGWTKRNLRRPDGLISFLWKGGHIVDPQAASDADLDAARALIVAGCRFKRPGLRQEGVQLGEAVMRIETTPLNGNPVLVAGPWAITPKVVLNPSYFSPATYAALRSASGDRRWDGMATTSRALASALMRPPNRLPPDWATLQGSTPVAIGSPGGGSAPVRFSFDAVRTLIRFAEDPDAVGKDIAARAWPVFANQDPVNLAVEHDVTGRPAGSSKHPIALVSAAGAAHAAGQTGARDGLLDAAETQDKHFSTYYGSAWVALGRIMLQTNLLTSCT